jgi:hypothetical protein
MWKSRIVEVASRIAIMSDTSPRLCFLSDARLQDLEARGVSWGCIEDIESNKLSTNQRGTLDGRPSRQS